MELLNNNVSCKAIDDRAGIAAMYECASELENIDHDLDIYFVCSCQEEVGHRGAKMVSHNLNPDIGIAIDTTFDSGPMGDTNRENILGNGPIICIGPNLHPKLNRRIMEIGRKYEIPYGAEVEPGNTGTDAWDIQITRSGIPSLLVSIPTKYMHTRVEVVNVEDIKNTGRLIAKFIEKLKFEDLEASFMLLERLCNAASPSAYEGEVREIIKDEIKDYVDEIRIDRMGNIIAHKRGIGKKIVVDAHMDEIGFIVTGYNEDGTLKFQPLGAMDTKIMPCTTVSIGKNRLPGVIGLKPIHLQDKEEKEKNIELSKLSMDIGAKSKEEAKSIVPIGEYAVFTTKFDYFGEGFIKGKAFDNRVGCGVLIELLKKTTTAIFMECFLFKRRFKIEGHIFQPMI